jgi:Domain of unknown function (DUF397)
VPSLYEKEYGMVDVPQVPAPVSWQRSYASGSESSDCVEVVSTQGYVWVRDSKNPLGPVLGFTHEEWSAFLIGMQRDEFNRSGVPA